MAVRTLPGLGLEAFWALGSSAWKPGMDTNMLLLSAVVGQRAASITTTPPGSPTTALIYIVPSSDPTNPNALAIWDGEAGAKMWNYFTPQTGWNFYIEDQDVDYQFDGTSWLTVSSGSSGMTQTEITTAHTVTNGDLAGNVVRRMNSASAQVITVNSGLTGTEPATFIQEGVGAVRFTAGAGVTIKSAGGNLALRARYSSATLIPDAGPADAFYLVGDLTT